MKNKSGSMAKFLRCEELRERAGLSIDALVVKVEGRPARSSIQRLEQGQAIRTSNVFRVANAINSELKKLELATFEAEVEISRT
jgi:hypothetical protein